MTTAPSLKKVLITDRFDLSVIKEHPWPFTIDFLDKENSKNEELPHHALVIRSKTKINEEFLKKFPQLELIVTATSGFDHIDFKATRARGLIVSHTPSAHVTSAAELTLCLIQNRLRRWPQTQKQIHRGTWDRTELVGEELEGQTVGIVGLGRIGKKVAQILNGYGCSIQYFDPYINKPIKNYKKVDHLDNLLPTSDIVSLHVPLTQETHHMIGQEQLQKMPTHGILINTCRGPVIEESSLIKALESKTIAGAALDVFTTEPLSIDHPLLKTNDISLSPHIGATTRQALNKASFEALQKVETFFNKESLKDTLPPQAPWYHNQL